MKKILVVGDIYTETQYFVDSIPGENEFSFAKRATTNVGSKSINVARVLIRLGNYAHYCGVVGEDSDGLSAIDQIKSYGIAADISRLSEQTTGKIAVTTPQSGKSSIVLSAGANTRLTPSLIDKIDLSIEQFDCVYTSTALPLESLYALANKCKLMSLPIFLDIPNQQKELDLSKVSNVDFFIPNRQEAELVTNMTIDSLDAAKVVAKKLRDKVMGTIIITLDKDGCVVIDKNETEPKHYKTNTVEIVDETGAGDIFRGVLVHSWLNKQNIDISIKNSLELATKSVSLSGVNKSIEAIDDKA